MAEPYGNATFKQHDDGRIEVVHADRVIGITLELLAEAGENLPVDQTGCILLAGYPEHRYRPVRFAGLMPDQSGSARVLVCEKVTADG